MGDCDATQKISFQSPKYISRCHCGSECLFVVDESSVSSIMKNVKFAIFFQSVMFYWQSHILSLSFSFEKVLEAASGFGLPKNGQISKIQKLADSCRLPLSSYGTYGTFWECKGVSTFWRSGSLKVLMEIGTQFCFFFVI